METLDFSDLTPTEVSVKLPGGRNCILLEATADAAIRFRNATQKARKYEDGKLVALEGLFDPEAQVVADCLYEVGPDDQPSRNGSGCFDPSKRVTVSAVRSLPVRVQTALYDKLLEISPGLVGFDTVASVEREIGNLQRRLEELRRAEGGGKN